MNLLLGGDLLGIALFTLGVICVFVAGALVGVYITLSAKDWW